MFCETNITKHSFTCLYITKLFTCLYIKINLFPYLGKFLPRFSLFKQKTTFHQRRHPLTSFLYNNLHKCCFFLMPNRLTGFGKRYWTSMKFYLVPIFSLGAYLSRDSRICRIRGSIHPTKSCLSSRCYYLFRFSSSLLNYSLLIWNSSQLQIWSATYPSPKSAASTIPKDNETWRGRG